ncbi:hypothetical protein C8J57DRAFT_102775 [Mycena rebaudengoi]|nr:hypothetical protein C8J57DRAFT_102775 [Mycena rebaudengoi]
MVSAAPDALGLAQSGLAKCVVCVLGCFAAHHMDMNGPQITSPSAPPSATFSSIFGARKGGAAASGPEPPQGGNPFNIHIKAPQESINAKLKDPANTTPGNPFSGKKLHPAEKSQLDGDLNPHESRGKARKPKRKMQADTEESEGSAPPGNQGHPRQRALVRPNTRWCLSKAPKMSLSISISSRMAPNC